MAKVSSQRKFQSLQSFFLACCVALNECLFSKQLLWSVCVYVQTLFPLPPGSCDCCEQPGEPLTCLNETVPWEAPDWKIAALLAHFFFFLMGFLHCASLLWLSDGSHSDELFSLVSRLQTNPFYIFSNKYVFLHCSASLRPLISHRLTPHGRLRHSLCVAFASVFSCKTLEHCAHTKLYKLNYEFKLN